MSSHASDPKGPSRQSSLHFEEDWDALMGKLVQDDEWCPDDLGSGDRDGDGGAAVDAPPESGS